MADQEAQLWITLAHMVGELQKRPRQATAYLLPAQLATARANLPRLKPHLARLAGKAAIGEGRPHEAIEHYRAALALDPDESAEVTIRTNLGNALLAVNRYADALEQMQRVYEADLERHGTEHPMIARDLLNLGCVHNALGATEDARNAFGRAVALNERLLGPMHTEVGAALQNLGNVETVAGAFDVARKHYERALAVFKQTLRPDHPNISTVLTNLGVLATEEGRLEEALALHEEALAIVTKSYPEGHPETFQIRTNLAGAWSDLGRNDEAIRKFEEVIGMHEAANRDDDMELAYPLMGMAQSLVEVNRASESVAFARRALALRLTGESQARLVADARFVVAMTEMAAGNRKVAFQEARQAAQTVAPDGPTPEPLHQEIVDWLAKHGG